MEDSSTIVFKAHGRPSMSEKRDCEYIQGDCVSVQDEQEEPCISRNNTQSVNTGDGCVQNNIEKLMIDMNYQLQKSIQTVTTEVRGSLSQLQNKLQSMQNKIDCVKVKTNNEPNPLRSTPSYDIPIRDMSSRDTYLGRGQTCSTPNGEDFNNNVPQIIRNGPYIPNDHITDPQSLSNLRHVQMQGDIPYGRHQTHLDRDTTHKLKPQTYDGSDELDEYLAQFNIISELNRWDYHTKSLFLASSIVGPARSLLCELDSEKRRDFDSIVSALQNRYVSVHKAEIFRSRLQSRVLGRNETITELAQSVKKLTRKAYPSASWEVVDLLALDYFVDALPDTDIRLRLREVGPKTISEAERIAVRLNAHKEADKSRGGRNYVRNVSYEESETDKKIDALSNQLKTLMEQMQNNGNNNDRHPQNHRPGNQRYQYNGSANGQNVRGSWQNRTQRLNRSGQPGWERNQSYRQNIPQGNGNGSNLRTEIQHQFRGPTQYH